jgi:hypothetical protein
MPPKRTSNSHAPWVQFVVWPLVVLVALFIFQGAITRFIGDATDTDIEFNGHGFSIHAKRPSPANQFPENDRDKGESPGHSPTPVATSTQTLEPSPSVRQSEWVFESTQQVGTFWTPEFDSPRGVPELAYSSPPVDENHQLRNPNFTVDKNGSGWQSSNFEQHQDTLGYPEATITPDGRIVTITYKC